MEDIFMLTITPVALKNLRDYFAQNRIDSPVRVVAHNGCSGPSLALALDENREGDMSFSEGGMTFLVGKDLLDECGDITVDFVTACSSGGGCSGCSGGGGFSVTSSRPLKATGGCGCSCSSGGCH